MNQIDFNYRLTSYLRALERVFAGNRTVLDIGCGERSLIQRFDWDESVGVDAHQKSVDNARARGTHDRLVCANLMELDQHFSENSFDVVVALDVIEHLPKEAGWKLLEAMGRIAKKRVVICTPNGFMPQPANDNPFQEHVSGWSFEELTDAGYSVVGLWGLKGLRGSYYELKLSPNALGRWLSRIADFWVTDRYPKAAAGLLCSKDVMPEPAVWGDGSADARLGRLHE